MGEIKCWKKLRRRLRKRWNKNKPNKNGENLQKLSVYYESPGVSEKYFEDNLRLLKSVFKIAKIERNKVSSIRELKIPHKSVYPRVLLTKEQIKTEYNAKYVLEGIGLSENSVVLVSYQKSGFSDTVYLIAHEIGHLFGMAHCNSKDCLMGVSRQGNYAWKTLSKTRKLSKRLFCVSCKHQIYSRPVTIDIG